MSELNFTKILNAYDRESKKIQDIEDDKDLRSAEWRALKIEWLDRNFKSFRDGVDKYRSKKFGDRTQWSVKKKKIEVPNIVPPGEYLHGDTMRCEMFWDNTKNIRVESSITRWKFNYRDRAKGGVAQFLTRPEMGYYHHIDSITPDINAKGEHEYRGNRITASEFDNLLQCAEELLVNIADDLSKKTDLEKKKGQINEVKKFLDGDITRLSA